MAEPVQAPLFTVYITGYTPGPASVGKNKPLIETNGLPLHIPPSGEAVNTSMLSLEQNGPAGVIVTTGEAFTTTLYVAEALQPPDPLTV